MISALHSNYVLLHIMGCDAWHSGWPMFQWVGMHTCPVTQSTKVDFHKSVARGIYGCFLESVYHYSAMTSPTISWTQFHCPWWLLCKRTRKNLRKPISEYYTGRWLWFLNILHIDKIRRRQRSQVWSTLQVNENKKTKSLTIIIS